MAGVVVVLLLVVGALAVAAGLVGWVLYRRKRLGQQLTAGTLNNIGMLIETVCEPINILNHKDAMEGDAVHV